MLRLIHTADWHLGQALHGVDRSWEHGLFLDWLTNLVETRGADVLVIAGDVFDVAHPSSAAQGQYYRFLAETRRRCPALTIVVVGGNHDSPARLDAPSSILGALGVRVVGGLPHPLRPEDLLIRVPGSGSEVRGWVLAVPFLRPRDLPGAGPLSADAGETGPRAYERLIDGHRRVYQALYDAVEPQLTKDQAVIVTGHCYMAGGAISELSERKIQVGNQHALPLDIFPKAASYVALGHLHRAQSIGDTAHVRYSGSPIPLSLTERDYPHQVLQVDFHGRRIESITAVPVPRSVEILRVPEEPAPLETVLPLLTALPRRADPNADDRSRPYLEVRVQVDEAAPRLRQDVMAALEGAWARLLRIDVSRVATEAAPATWLPAKPLDRLTPAEVFEACYRRARHRDPSEAQRALFAELVQAVHTEEESS